MKYLITGATGYIGKNLVMSLHSAGHEVHILTRANSDTSAINSFISKRIIIDEINPCLNYVFEETSYDLVIHLATLFKADHKSEDVHNMIKANFSFGIQLVEAMTSNGSLNLINFTTSWQDFSETDALPVNLYASLKKAFSDTLPFYKSTRALSYLNLRIYDTYGPFDDRGKILPLLLKTFLNKKKLGISPGGQYLDLVYVSDIISGILHASDLLLSRTIDSYEYCLASQKPVQLKEIVSTLNSMFTRNDLIELGGRSYRPREIMKPYYPYKQLPGWQPKYNLNQGIKEILIKQFDHSFDE